MSIDTHRAGAANGAAGTDAENPTESLVAASVGDRCVKCGAALVSDQRYCVVCGERRGAPRFTLPTNTAASTSGAPARSPRRRRTRPRMTSGATLVAGVGTLLLAMGVGVLIGHDTGGNTRTVAAKQPKIEVVNTGGTGSGSSTPSSSSSTAGTGSSGSASSTGSSSGGSSSSSKSAKSSSSKSGSSGGKGSSGSSSSASSSTPSSAAAKKASQAATKVLGGNAAGGIIKKGQTGTGKGYSPKTHKFTGNFFGG